MFTSPVIEKACAGLTVEQRGDVRSKCDREFGSQSADSAPSKGWVDCVVARCGSMSSTKIPIRPPATIVKIPLPGSLPVPVRPRLPQVVQPLPLPQVVPPLPWMDQSMFDGVENRYVVAGAALLLVGGVAYLYLRSKAMTGKFA